MTIERMRWLLMTGLFFACSNAVMEPGPGGGGGSGGGSEAAPEVCDNRTDDDGDTFTDCADQDCFADTACFASCLDLCTAGAFICDGSGVRSCQLSATSGCRSFGVPVACGMGLVCSGGGCVSTCTDQCTAGEKACSASGGVVECQRRTTGCTDWVGPVSCASNQVCSGGTCVTRGTCTHQCTPGAARCTAGGQQQSCAMQPAGCADWSFPAACAANEICAAGANGCQPIVRCTAGDKRCAAGAPAIETCDPSGAWIQTQTCTQGCAAAACTASASCNAGAVRCNASDVEICNGSGTAWLHNESCTMGCAAGLCTGPCASGAKRCNGDAPETCGTGGTWSTAPACANGCWAGTCMQAELLVDGVTTTLEGDVRVKNDIIIRNGGSLRVGPSGVLKLRARNVTIDAASNIDATGVGDESRGAGGTRTVSCTNYYTYAGQSYTCPVSKNCSVGSSYGTQGSSCGAEYLTRSCGPSGLTVQVGCTSSTAQAPPPYDREDDLSISEGSVNGSSKGGGLVQVVAQSVTLQGRISANAAGGSGSGGGVLIAAETLSGAGTVATSGSGDGGQGRVKLLRGVPNGFTGSVTGRRTESPLPPLDIISSSHPDPQRWYNDGLGDWQLAWSKPFATLNGYFVKASTSSSDVPSQANGAGTFHQRETFTVPAADLVAGSNYFHVVSVDGASNVGTVKAMSTVQLNKTPPTVSSSSHPSQRTWYSSGALFFSWTNPQADANFTGYYTVLDKFGDTVPPQVAANFTTQKQLLLPNTPDGIWTFHVVNRDTRGAVTKTARHYTVYLGTAPGLVNLSGSVLDASNNSAPLSGATVSVNRNLFSTATTPSGTYTFGGNLFAGAWEVTASKPGYLPQTKMVTLVAGTPMNETFSLTLAP